MTFRTRALTMIGLLGLVLFALAAPAAADGPSDTYRASMRDLVSWIDDWNEDVDMTLTAMALKPELACGTEYAQLVQRGSWLADDLRGSADSAPTALRAAHLAAADGLEQALAGARMAAGACDGRHLAAGQALFEGGVGDFDGHVLRIRLYISGSSVGVSLPGLPIQLDNG